MRWGVVGSKLCAANAVPAGWGCRDCSGDIACVRLVGNCMDVTLEALACRFPRLEGER